MVLSVSVAGCQRVPREPYALRWQLEKGTVYAIELRLSFRIDSRELPDGERKSVDGTIIYDMNWTVDSIDDDGVASLTQRVNRVRVRGKGNLKQNEQIDYDSASGIKPAGKAAEVARDVKPLLDSTSGVKLSLLGKVLEVTRSRRVAVSVGPRAMNPTDRKELQEMLTTFVGNLPERKMTTGDSWEARSTLSRRAEGFTYTYRGIRRHQKRPLAFIEVSYAPDKKPPPRFGRRIKRRELSGQTWFDPVGGFLAESQLRFATSLDTVRNGKAVRAERQIVTIQWKMSVQ